MKQARQRVCWRGCLGRQWASRVLACLLDLWHGDNPWYIGGILVIKVGYLKAGLLKDSRI